jgi:hypothetical protein
MDLDCVAKSIVEGCIFIYRDSTNLNLNRINGNNVHLCSHVRNQNFNANCKIHVELIFEDDNDEESYDGHYKISMDELLHIYCFDDKDCLVLGGYNYGDIDLYNKITKAYVIVSCYRNNEFNIECTHVEHNLEHKDIKSIHEYGYDNRSVDSKKYCQHKNFPW